MKLHRKVYESVFTSMTFRGKWRRTEDWAERYHGLKGVGDGRYSWRMEEKEVSFWKWILGKV